MKPPHRRADGVSFKISKERSGWRRKASLRRILKDNEKQGFLPKAKVLIPICLGRPAAFFDKTVKDQP